MERNMEKRTRSLLLQAALVLAALLLSACATRPYQINIMPPPEVYDDELISPFTTGVVQPDRNELPILYATARRPAAGEDKEAWYRNERGQVLRLGLARIIVAQEGKSWDDLTHIEDMRAMDKGYPLQVGSVEEYGILEESLTIYTEEPEEPETMSIAEQHFLQDLQSQLTRSESNDIFIFVHGYNVNFEDPLLMSSELWHFLGYRGAFIAFSWPATPRNTAYVGDLDTAAITARAFREFLGFLARESGARKIHILGYSAGTRLVTQTLYQMKLLRDELPPGEAAADTKLGTVLLVSSDMDRELFASYLTDGQLGIMEQMNIYVSADDMALVASRVLHSYPRLGEMWQAETINAPMLEYLRNEPRLEVIDVSRADRTTTRGGHFYFLDSPWVSSDVLMTLYSGVEPAQRGLVPHETLPLWTFPDDYVSRLRRQMLEQSGQLTAP